jgi:hypothetical protein
MKKALSIVFAALIVLSLAAIACAYFGVFGPKTDPGLTIVAAPEQTKAQRPPCFPDPEANYIPMPEGENYALGKPVSSGEHTDVYVIENVNDGKTDTYWESKGFPAEVSIDLGVSRSISTAAVRLNPSSIWEARTQEIAVLVSADGESFTEAAAAAKYDFDPNTGNRIRIDFPAAEARFVKLVFTLNTSSRTGGAQAAEIEVYD